VIFQVSTVPTITDEMREFKLNKKLNLLEEEDEEIALASSSVIKKDVMVRGTTCNLHNFNKLMSKNFELTSTCAMM